MTNLTALRYNPDQVFEVETTDVEYRNDGEESWLATIYQPKGPGLFRRCWTYTEAPGTGASGAITG
jgi:hypothetical protein